MSNILNRYEKLYTIKKEKIDYAIIEMSYSNRITIDMINEINEESLNEGINSKIILTSYIHNINNNKHKDIKKIIDNNISYYDGVVVKCSSVYDVLDISKEIMKYKFCGFYTEDNLDEVNFYKLKEFNLLHLIYDTESG